MSAAALLQKLQCRYKDLLHPLSSATQPLQHRFPPVLLDHLCNFGSGGGVGSLQALAVFWMLKSCLDCIFLHLYRLEIRAGIRQIDDQSLAKPKRRRRMGASFHQQVDELMPQSGLEDGFLLQRGQRLKTDDMA